MHIDNYLRAKPLPWLSYDAPKGVIVKLVNINNAILSECLCTAKYLVRGEEMMSHVAPGTWQRRQMEIEVPPTFLESAAPITK